MMILLVLGVVAAACGGGGAATSTTTTTIVLGGGADPTTTTTAAPATTTTTVPATTTTTAAAVATAGSGPDCLVGTWNPEQSQLEDFLLTLYRPYAADASLDGGTIDLILGEDGSFAQNYNGIVGSGTAAGVAVTMEFTGGSFGTWEATDDLMAISFEGSDIGVVVNGSPATAPSIPPGMVEAGYVCNGDELEVVPPPSVGGLWPLPRNWTKVG